MIEHPIRIIWTTLQGLLILMLCLITWGLATTEGSRELAMLANLIDERVTLDIRAGSLLQGLTADSLEWNDDALEVHAKKLDGRWDPRCLLSRKFCLQTLKIDELSILVKDTAPANTRPKREQQISLPSITLPIGIEAKQIIVDRLRIVRSDDSPPIELENLRIEGDAVAQTIQLKKLSVRYSNVITSLSGTVSLEDNYPLSANIDSIIENLVDSDSLTFTTRLNGDLSNLSLEGKSIGLLTTAFKARTNLLDPKFPSSGSLDWESLSWPLNNGVNNEAVYQSERGNITFSGNLDSVDLSASAKLAGRHVPDVDVELQGLATPSGLYAKSININTLQGNINGSASVNWENKLTWQNTIQFSDVNPGTKYPEFPGNLGGSLLSHGIYHGDGKWTLSLRPLVIQGDLRGTPLHMHAVVQHSDETPLIAESIRLVSKDNLFHLSGRIDEHWDLTSSIDLGHIAQLFPDAAGSLSGKISVSGAFAQPLIKTELHSDILRWKTDEIENLQVSAVIDDLFHAESQLSVRADAITISEQQTASLDSQIKGSRKQHSANLTLSAKEDLATSLAIVGSIDDAMHWRGKLRQSEIKLPQHTLTLAQDSDLSWSPDSNDFILGAHCWQNTKTRLCLQDDARISSTQGEIKLALQRYDLDQMNGFFPSETTISGQTRANASISWNPQLETGPAVIFNVDSQDLRISTLPAHTDTTVEFHYETLSINGQANRDSISTNILVQSDTVGKATANLFIDPTSKPLAFTRGTLDIQAFKLAVLQGLLPSFEKLAGTLNARGNLTGAVLDPAFVGEIRLSDPTLASPDIPVSIAGGEVTASLAGTAAKLSGKLESGNGAITLAGFADWENPQEWQLALELNGSALVVNQKPLLESVIAPQLSISLKPRTVKIGGEVKVLAAAINVKELPENTTTLSPEIIIDTGTLDTVENTKTPDWLVETNLRVILGDAVRLSGYGARAKLSGDFRLAKSGTQPLQYFGEITVPEGIYKSYGQDLSIEEGQVVLVGPLNQTALDINAFRKVDDIKAGLNIGGTLAQPLLTLYSEPAMEQERILAYIVLGRDIDSAEDSDSNILAAAALSMGIANGRGLATDIAEAFGIREFNIEASGSGDDTQVLLSGRLSERLLVSYGVGVFSLVNTLYLRYDLGKNLYLETAQGIDRAVDLIYSFEF